jgi:hypothetical protein
MDLIVLVPITVIFVAAMIAGRNELVRRSLFCPRKWTMAGVEIQRRSLRPTTIVGIKSCSLLPGAKKVDCDQACLKQAV